MVPVAVPPPEYDYEPTRPYYVEVLPPEAVKRRCFGIPIACAIPGLRLIVVSSELSGSLLEAVLRHEKAHLNGWQH